jgi:RNA polymerase sigma factor (sigma-70 family)
MKSPSLGPLLHTLFRFRALACEGQSDAALLERFTLQGDQEAFAALVQRHGPMVLSLCRRLLRDDHEAGDAFQATFLILVRKSPAIRQPEQLGSWLHGVAYRTALRLRQKASRWQGGELDLDARPGPDADPLDRLAWQELRGILDEEIQRLPVKYQLPMILCYLQGQSYSEAARSLGCPAGTVSARLARARDRLRQRLARRGLCLSASLLGCLLSREALGAAVPAELFRTTVQAGVCALAGPAALAAVVSGEVIWLTEGVVRAMWTTKLKATLLAGLLVGLLGTGMGGLAWHAGGEAVAQTPFPGFPGGPDRPGVRPPAPGFPARDEARTIEEEERQIQQLEAQLKEIRARLAQRRAHPGLDEIEAGLQKLRKATASNAKNRQAVEEFTRSFARLKDELSGRADRSGPAARGGTGGSAMFRGGGGYGLAGPIQDGVVLQVDAEGRTALLSVGKKDGVKKGDVYRSYQGGKATPDQTGWLEVTEVNSNWSVARITQNFGPRAPMQARDILQTDRPAGNPAAPGGLRPQPAGPGRTLRPGAPGAERDPRLPLGPGGVRPLGQPDEVVPKRE